MLCQVRQPIANNMNNSRYPIAHYNQIGLLNQSKKVIRKYVDNFGKEKEGGFLVIVC